MKVAIKNNWLWIKSPSDAQAKGLKGWTRWDKKAAAFYCYANLQNLDRLAELVAPSSLPEDVEYQRQWLARISKAVDDERLRDEPNDYFNYPVKVKLFKHQKRAANMAGLLFGFLEPIEGPEDKQGPEGEQGQAMTVDEVVRQFLAYCDGEVDSF